LKYVLAAESFFTNLSVAMTRSIFIVYLAWLGYGLREVSYVVLLPSAASALAALQLYWRPCSSSRLAALLLGAEKAIWLLAPYLETPGQLTLAYTADSVLYTAGSACVASLVYEYESESEVMKVTSSRTVLGNLATIAGLAASTGLLALLEGWGRYWALFTLGSILGLPSSLVLLFHRPPCRKEASKEQGGEELVFSSSLFMFAFLLSSNLLGLAWTPYLVSELGAADYIASARYLVAALATIPASFYWVGRRIRSYRYSLLLSALTPVLVLAVRNPLAHLPMTLLTSFSFTGASFLGVFLFATYRRRLGSAKAAALTVVLMQASQLAASLIGLEAGGSYHLVLGASAALRLGSVALALAAIPEVSMFKPSTARVYASLLYWSGVQGYTVALAFTRESILLLVKLSAAALALLLLYTVIRIMYLIAASLS